MNMDGTRRAIAQHAGKRCVRGQSTAEYAIVFGVVLAALVGMQIYFRRGLNARVKDASDSTMEAVWTKLGRGDAPTPTDLQYEPYYSASDYTVTQDASREEAVEPDGVVKRRNINETAARQGSQETKAAADQ